jgi:hypothetical protein
VTGGLGDRRPEEGERRKEKGERRKTMKSCIGESTHKNPERMMSVVP